MLYEAWWISIKTCDMTIQSSCSPQCNGRVTYILCFFKTVTFMKSPPPCVATQGHPQDNETDQRSLSCTPSLHWLAPCTCKSHGGRARYVSGSASFHILSDLLTHIHILTCSAGKDQISICLHAAFWSLSGFRPHKRWTHIKAHACKRHYVPAGG